MRKLLAMALLLVPCFSQAASRPPELPGSIHASAPVGTAQLHKLFFHVYDASFWSDHGSNLKAPYALSITYAMELSREDVIERTVTEMKHVSTLPDATLQENATQLQGMWPDLHKGDRITAYSPDGKQTVFYVNGTKTGTIADAQFTPAFFGIWLSPKSSEPEMRSALLALNSAE